MRAKCLTVAKQLVSERHEPAPTSGNSQRHFPLIPLSIDQHQRFGAQTVRPLPLPTFSKTFETLGKLILPEVFEAVRRQGRVADRGHDRSVAEIGLDGASVVAVVGELEPAACRSMSECTRNVNFAATPALATMR